MAENKKPPIGVIVRRKMMANGNVRVEIEYEATEDLRCAQLFPHGSSVVAVPITVEAAKDATTEAFIGEEAQPEPPPEKVAEKSSKGPWGKEAQALHISGWYNSPNVHYALKVNHPADAVTAMRSLFDVKSMSMVAPAKILEWAIVEGIVYTLPKEIKNHG